MRRGAQGHAQLKLLLWRGDCGVGCSCSCRVRRRVHRGSMNRGKRNDGQPSRSSSTRTTTNKATPRTKPTQSPRSCFNVRRAPHLHGAMAMITRGCTQAMWQGVMLNDTRHDPALGRAQSIETTPLPFSPSFCEQRPQQMGRTNKLGTRRGKEAPYHEGARCVSHKHGRALLGDDLTHKGSRVLTPIERCRSLSLVVKARCSSPAEREPLRCRRPARDAPHQGDEPRKTAGHLQHDTSAHGSHVSAGGSSIAIAT